MGFLSDIRQRLGRWALESNDDVSTDDMAKALADIGIPPSTAGFGSNPVADASQARDAITASNQELSKGMAQAGFPKATDEKPRAMFHDPYAVMDWGGWRQRPSALTYDTLRQMSASNTVIAAIINHRMHQVAAFARPQQGRYDRGFRIIHRDRRDESKSMTKGEEKEASKIERYLEATGVLLEGERPGDRDSLRSFSKKFVRDTLTYDQACFEIIRDRIGRPSRFLMLPSETIRPAVADTQHMDLLDRMERVSHVQIYDESVIAEFAPQDIAWCIMNPRSDLRTNDFGFSPIEQIIQLVTAWLFGFTHNQNFFRAGSAIKGFINIKGAIPDRAMQAFRRQWYSMVTGVTNAWKTPVLNADEVQWHSMHSSNRDMEFNAWMDWLTKLICAVFGIDPLELNFNFGSSGSGGSMFDSRPNAHEVLESKDKGLRPLLMHFEDSLNREVLWDINPDFEFSFVGYDAKAEGVEREARIAAGKAYYTVNENRAFYNEKPIDGGDIILDPVFQAALAQAAQQEMMEEQNEAMAEEGGSPFDMQDDDKDAKGDKDGDAQAANSNAVPKPDKSKSAEGKEDRLAASLRSVGSLRKADYAEDVVGRWLPGGMD